MCVAPQLLIAPRSKIMMIMISSEMGTLPARPLLLLCAAVTVTAVTTAVGSSEVARWSFNSFFSLGAGFNLKREGLVAVFQIN